METATDLRQKTFDQARAMSFWLKLLGIITILSAVPAAITIIGLVVAWLPILLGVLLLQAGIAAQRGSEFELLRLVEKLKTYFLIQGVLVIIFLVVGAILMLFFGAAMIEMIREAAQNSTLLEA